MIEIELLDAGLLLRLRDAHGHETLRLSDAGIAALAQSLQRNRAARSAHELLVERVAREMQRAGRIAWRGLALRTHVAENTAKGDAGRWAIAMPDVFSVRNTTVEGYLEPLVHEIKVQRSDLLSDLRIEAKRSAYLNLSSACWYVIKAGIARAEDIPPECGVLVATDDAFEVARAAPRRAVQPGFALWMALARATPMDNAECDGAQSLLGDSQQPLPLPTDPI